MDQLCKRIDSYYDNMVSTLEALVNIDSGADCPEGIKEVRELILKLNRDRKITVLISSHILGELSKFATRYGIIHHGKLIEEFTENQLWERCSSKDGTRQMDLEDYFLSRIGGR